MAFSDYQLEIYLQGLSGVLPSLPMTFAELEAKAQSAMPPGMWSYVAGGGPGGRKVAVAVLRAQGDDPDRGHHRR